MKQLPREQRPYEKCFMQGEGSLNDTELLAVILRSGTSGKNSLALAQEILKFMESSSYPGLMGLMHVSVQDLMKIHGIGQVKAVQLKCIGELSKRIAKADIPATPFFIIVFALPFILPLRTPDFPVSYFSSSLIQSIIS